MSTTDLASPVLYHLSSLSSLPTGQAALMLVWIRMPFSAELEPLAQVNEEALSVLSCSSLGSAYFSVPVQVIASVELAMSH